MNTQANAVREASLPSQDVAAAAIPATRRMAWAIRREVWENRSIIIAPLVMAGLTLLGSLLHIMVLPARMRAAASLGAVRQHELLAQPYSIGAGVLMLTTIAVGLFYCLDALYGERRDRSILFWKSLPVSDLETVLSKFITPLLVLPLVAFCIGVAMQVLMLAISSVVLASSGLSVGVLWTHAAVIQTWPMLFYHLMTAHGLGLAPVYGWLLLVSAWARRAPLLWAVLPPLAIAVLEKLAFNTSYFAWLVAQRVIGGPGDDNYMASSLSTDPLLHYHPGHFLLSPSLWIGFVVAAIFIAATVHLRRNASPI